LHVVETFGQRPSQSRKACPVISADAGSKARKAAELGVRIITEAEWRELAG
jgi:DNA ligase (NAD+)